MNKTNRTVAKNVGVLFASQIITWALAILLVIFLPRYLGAAEIGRYQLAGSIWTIVGIFITFGMDTFLTKEIARAPEKTTQLFGISILLRSLLILLGFGFVWLYSSLLHYPVSTNVLLFIVGIANVFIQFSGATAACLQGMERFEFTSLSDIVSKAFMTLVTIVLLLLGYRVIMAAIVLAVSALISLAIQIFALSRLKPLALRFQWEQGKRMLESSLPYMINVGIRTAYVQIDILIISWVATEIVIGWYSAASRLFSTLLFIPTVLMAAFFPAMSRIHSSAPHELPIMIRKNFDIMLLFGVPIGLGLFVIADQAVHLLFGAEFAPSGPVLSLMGIVLIMTYLNILLGQYLISTDRQNTWTWVMAAATLVTIPLDFFLIPLCERLYHNGAIGGALSFLVTEAGMTIYGIWILPKGTLNRSNIWVAARVIFAGVVMVIVTWGFRQTFILIPILVGMATYIFLVWLMRIVPKEDWMLLKSLIRGAVARFRKTESTPTEAGGSL